MDNQKVVALIDPGATHNFISDTLVKKLKLPVSPTEECGVALGTGEAVKSKGICCGVNV